MKQCLVIVDYQRDFVTGSLGFPGAVAIEQALTARLQTALEQGWDIYCTLDTHDEGRYFTSREGVALPIGHCFAGTDGWKLYGRVGELVSEAPEGRVRMVEKNCYGSEDLRERLMRGRYDAVLFGGVVTHICVLSNAILCQSALPDIPITVDAACCASNDPALHEKALDVLEGLNIHVINRKIGDHPALETIRTRRSVRAYQQRPIPRAVLARILDAAQWAPSGSNRQDTELIVLTRAEDLETINQAVRQAYLRYPLDEETYPAIAAGCRAARANDYCFTFQAPVLVIAAGRRDNQNAMADSACMLENLMLAAHSLGVGSCYVNQPRWMGEQPALRQTLSKMGVDSSRVICGAAVLGYAAGEAPKAPARKPGRVRFV